MTFFIGISVCPPEMFSSNVAGADDNLAPLLTPGFWNKVEGQRPKI